MFLVVSRSEVHFGFDKPFFLRARSGAQLNLRARKIGRLERNLSTPDTVSATFLLVCFLSLKESTCETSKSIFYFTSKPLFILERIKF